MEQPQKRPETSCDTKPSGRFSSGSLLILAQNFRWSQGTWCVKMAYAEESSRLQRSVNTSLSFNRWMNLPDLINGSKEQWSLIFWIWENLEWSLRVPICLSWRRNSSFTYKSMVQAGFYSQVCQIPASKAEMEYFNTLLLIEEFLNQS